MEGYGAQDPNISAKQCQASRVCEEAVKKASDGDFDGAEGLLWTIAAIFHGGGGVTEDDPLYMREAEQRVVYGDGGFSYRPGKSLIPPRDPAVNGWVTSCVANVDAAKTKWAEGLAAHVEEELAALAAFLGCE